MPVDVARRSPLGRSALQSPLGRSALAIPLSPDVEAHEPPEARGIGRGDVRLLVSHGASSVSHAVFSDLGEYLLPGDTLVVNSSATIPAAIDAVLPGGRAVRVHFSTELPGGFWLVEGAAAGRQHDRSVRC